MSATELLTNLLQRRIQLWVEGDRLRFRAPQGTLTEALRSQLKQHKTEIIAIIEKFESAERKSLPKLVNAPEQCHEPFVLNDLQQTFAIACDQFFELGNVSAHYYLEFEIDDLDIVRLNNALKRLIQTHQALRIVILASRQQQILEEIPEYEIEVVDLREKDSSFVKSHLETTRRRFRDRGPSIDTWPLFEAIVDRLDEQKFLLHFSVALIICDALSSGIILPQLFELYQDPQLTIKPLDISYRDYTLALDRVKHTNAYQKSKEYWWNRLDTLPNAPDLPLIKQLNSIECPSFRRWSARLEAERWERVKKFAARLGLKPASTIGAIYAAVLNTWNRNSHFTLNFLYFNRLPLHSEVHKLVGNFSSTVLVEVDFSQSSNFITYAKALQTQLWKDLEHTFVSGVEVLGEINRRQGGSTRGVMPVTFASALGLHSRSNNKQNASSMVDTWILKEGGLQTPFTLLDHQVLEDRGALVITWDTVEEAFPPNLMQDMFNSYYDLLEQLADDETAWEKKPELIPAYQLKQRAVINATETPISKETLHGLFAAQVDRHPSHPAVVAPQRTFTYKELDRYSNCVGSYLRQIGAKVNEPVGVVMDKGWEQIVAILGILKSGAPYLPIDPKLPKERLLYLLENSDVKLILTQSWVEKILVWPENVQTICIDKIDPDQQLAVDSDHLNSLQTIEDLAYIIYTSGSTGKPKGVAIDHRGAVNTILDINRRFDVGSNDRVFAISSLSFDLSVYDIFGPLAAGATIVMPDAKDIRDPSLWSEVMVKEQVTVWNSAPPLMKILAEYAAGNAERLPACLKLVLLSGDWIPVNLPSQLKSLVPNVKIISLGGATEASIWSIFYPIETVKSEWTSIPYGKPLTNQTFHVLDRSLEPCPIWVTGDLYIGGIGLAKCYWNNPEKTAASFIYHQKTGDRLYRTGDLGRYLPDGNIEFRGREDFQVKVRGYRIELGEIEAALIEHPEIETAVVTSIEDDRGDKQLVAYFILKSLEVQLSDSSIRQFLQEKLAEYMIPAYFLRLDSLPITSNGKIDRKALPRPQENDFERSSDFVAPRDTLELELLQLWKEILPINSISVTDNFFELGGNSISAVRLVTQIQNRFGEALPLSLLFQQGTIEKLAQQLRQQQPSRPWSSLVEIKPGSKNLPFFCIHPVGGNVFCYTELAQHLGSNQPFYGLQSVGLNPEQKPLTSIEEMASCYLDEIRKIQYEGPYLLGGWSFGSIVAFEMAQQLLSQGQQVASLVAIDCKIPDPDLVLDDALLAAWFIQDLKANLNSDLDLLRLKLDSMDSNAQLNYILRQAKKLNLVPTDAGSPQIKNLFHVFTENMRAMYRYRPKAYFERFVLFRAREQYRYQDTSQDLGWNQFIPNGAKVHTIPGNHYTILQNPHVSILAEHLKSYL